MEVLKSLLIAAFAPAAQRWAFIEGNPHAPRGRARVSMRGKRYGKRARASAFWRLVPAR
jgi:hypothetical protein